MCKILTFSRTSLQCDVSEASGQLSNIKEDVQFAACDLVCEWAQKVLKRQFDAVEDLARFLIDSHYISNKSLAALTITASTASGKNQSAFIRLETEKWRHLVAQLPLIVFHIYKIMSWIINVTLQKHLHILNNLLLLL